MPEGTINYYRGDIETIPCCSNPDHCRQDCDCEYEYEDTGVITLCDTCVPEYEKQTKANMEFWEPGDRCGDICFICGKESFVNASKSFGG